MVSSIEFKFILIKIGGVIADSLLLVEIVKVLPFLLLVKESLSLSLDSTSKDSSKDTKCS